MGTSLMPRSEATTGGPMVMFGVKWPSMTSTWMRSAPASITCWISSPMRLKSHARMEGATLISGVM